MMGYILTENRVIEINEDITLNLNELKKQGKCVEYNGERVIRAADTIGGLCDVFLTYNKKLDSYGMIQLWQADWLLNKPNVLDRLDVYGAILMKDKNGNVIAKTIAKVNDKGKLELITITHKVPFYKIIATCYRVEFISDQNERKIYWITKEQYNDLLKELENG